MLEVDSQSITPPSSPILGYSGCHDEQSIIDAGIIFCLNCKGQPRPGDYSFNPESYILRREVIRALEITGGGGHNVSFGKGGGNRGGGDKPKLVRCFGHLMDPLEKEQVKQFILVCRKNICSLEVLSESAHAFIVPPNIGGGGFEGEDPEDADRRNPWTLRQNVCHFLNVILRNLKYYKGQWKAGGGGGLEELFAGLKGSLQAVKEWSSVLRTHCGFRNGNECDSAAYHFFHLQLELRWCLLLIFGVTPEVIGWVLDDLVQLGMYRYASEQATITSLDGKQPFNCVCVKEIWTMICLLVEEIKPEQKGFWDYYAEAMQRQTSQAHSDIFFPIWLTANLAQISEYTLAGVYSAGRGKENGDSNGYKYLHGVLKDWQSRGGKSAEVLKLSFRFLQHWGSDCETVICLWNQWVPRLDKGNEVTNFEVFSTVEKWLQLITKLCGGDMEEISSGRRLSSGYQQRHSYSDPFLEFASLVAAHVKLSNERDIRRLNSNICNKLTRANASDYGELGMLRVSTLFMVLSSSVNSAKDAMSMCERLHDIINYSKGRPSSPAKKKTILKAYSTLILIMLGKQVEIQGSTLLTAYMKTVDEMLCYSSANAESTKKELAMIYVDLLDCLTEHTPAFSTTQAGLGRELLISSNLQMWLANAGPNHVLRTVRALQGLTSWIGGWVHNRSEFEGDGEGAGGGGEAKQLFKQISDRSLSFLKSSAVVSYNRIPSTDMEPLANLAGDITLLTRKFSQKNKAQDEIAMQFDLFAMCERTCPEVSQYYVQRLFSRGSEFVQSVFADIRWTQCWLRLVFLDKPCPDELTELVLGTSFCSTSSHALLMAFCKKEEGDYWGRDDLQRVLSPVTPLIKGIMEGSLFKGDDKHSEEIVGAVVRSCTVVLRHIRLDKLYIRGDANSVGNQWINVLVPCAWPGVPPWERLSIGLLKQLEVNLYDVFCGIVNHPGTNQDPVLKRKLQDCVVLSFFGFVRNPEEVDKDEHPLLKILNYCEDHNVAQVQNQILPQVVAGDNVVKDVKLSQQFLKAVTVIRAKGFPTLVCRVLGGLIRIFLIHSSDKVNMNSCVNAVVYCCQFALIPLYNVMVVQAFEAVLEKEFAFRSKRVFQLCSAVAKCNKVQGRKFLKRDLLPMLGRHAQLCEQRRGIGCDKSLRNPLEMLEREVADVEL